MDVCTWRPEVDVRYLSLSTLLLLFKTGSLTEPETCHFPGWPASAPILSISASAATGFSADQCLRVFTWVLELQVVMCAYIARILLDD